MAQGASRLAALYDEADEKLGDFYRSMLRLKGDRPDSLQLDMLRRARAALESRDFRDALLQAQGFWRAARRSISSSEKETELFAQMEEALQRLKRCVETDEKESGGGI